MDKWLKCLIPCLFLKSSEYKQDTNGKYLVLNLNLLNLKEVTKDV